MEKVNKLPLGFKDFANNTWPAGWVKTYNNCKTRLEQHKFFNLIVSNYVNNTSRDINSI